MRVQAVVVEVKGNAALAEADALYFQENASASLAISLILRKISRLQTIPIHSPRSHLDYVQHFLQSDLRPPFHQTEIHQWQHLLDSKGSGLKYQLPLVCLSLPWNAEDASSENVWFLIKLLVMSLFLPCGL